MTTEVKANEHKTKTWKLSLLALGVVFGDIGTSPLYAIRETFHYNDLPVNNTNVLGVLSLVFWSLVIIISIKYLLFVLKASNNGEGGIMALTSLLVGERGKNIKWTLILLGAFGTALLLGDGAITPAISVLAAVEGLGVAQPALAGWVLPISIIILVVLFSIQRKGTASVGRLFGPIMILWFSVLGLLGLSHIGDDWSVLRAVNPVYAFQFFTANAFTGFLAMGSLFLVVTGGEALYADMGHFGKRPMTIAWYTIVLPGLLLCYFGQGAMILAHPETIEQPFYAMAPVWGVLPLTILATLATVIASQALITGAFSLAMQASALGWLPRINIKHTSESERGQIYVPTINRALMVACIMLVLGFRTSGNLAAAYGLAVSADMVITTILFHQVAIHKFKWNKTLTTLLCGAFLVIDLAFFGANAFKFFAGGWLPVVGAVVLFTVMTTWKYGRDIVARRLHRGEVQLEEFLKKQTHLPLVPGVGVYLYSLSGAAPPALQKNITHYHVLHENIVFLSVNTLEVPRVDPEERTTVNKLRQGVWQIEMNWGFMEKPDVPAGLRQGEAAELHLLDSEDVTYFLGSENLIVTKEKGMALWRERLFVGVHRNAARADRWFNLPPEKVVTVGSTVEI